MQEADDIMRLPEPPTEAASPDSASSTPAWRYRLAVVQHYRVVYRTARALLRDPAEAEDVTQEAFVRFWRHGASVLKPREWLLKVARNACLDRLRRSRRLVSEADCTAPEEQDERGPAWHLEQRELSVRLQRALETLAEPQRSLVVLFDMQGRNGDECARILGLNVNQVKVYLHRARRRLRVELEKQS